MCARAGSLVCEGFLWSLPLISPAMEFLVVASDRFQGDIAYPQTQIVANYVYRLFQLSGPPEVNGYSIPRKFLTLRNISASNNI